MTRNGPPVVGDADDTSMIDTLQRQSPTKAQLSAMEGQGVGVHDTTDGITFDREWNYEQVHSRLLKLLPLPLSYMEIHFGNETSLGKDGAVRKRSQWLLLSKNHQQLELLPYLQFPTGVDLDRFASGSGTHSGWNKVVIFLSTWWFLLYIYFPTNTELSNYSNPSSNTTRYSLRLGARQQYHETCYTRSRLTTFECERCAILILVIFEASR